MKRYYWGFILAFFVFQNIFSQIGIYTEDPNPLNIDQVSLDVNSRIMIRNLEEYDSPDSFIKPIGVDKNGVLIRIGNVPTVSAFYQSKKTNTYSDDDITTFNTTKELLVSWDPSDDLIFDDLLEFNSDENSFSFLGNGQYEVGGFINFGMLMPNSYVNAINNFVGINVTIQYQRKDNVDAGWQDLSTCRKVFTDGLLSKTDYRFLTMRIPPVLYPFSKGDKLRVIIKKPIGMLVGSIQISNPKGSLFSKALRVRVP